jgi:hypothetical protein
MGNINEQKLQDPKKELMVDTPPRKLKKGQQMLNEKNK